MADSRKLLLKESYNNVFDTAEILWLLKGNESLSALDFVCKYIVNDGETFFVGKLKDR